MQLLPLDSPERLRLAVAWLSEKDNYQWLDVGDGRQLVTAEWLRIGQQRGTYVVRLFTGDGDDTPIGVVGLSNISRHFKTANIWVVLGEKRCANRGYASRATSLLLTYGFQTLGLIAIHTWIVAHNPSVRVAEKVGFKPIGRQRLCHRIDGRAYDRLWFDLLATEHEEILDAERRRSA
jgi:RimJ/RimL family protein N-acetyltransferase